MQFFGQFTAYWAQLMAFIVLSSLPAVIFYLVAEQHIITGLTGGALKG
jgi:raffinose/stachyose/melibiose transport system permease protein